MEENTNKLEWNAMKNSLLSKMDKSIPTIVDILLYEGYDFSVNFLVVLFF